MYQSGAQLVDSEAEYGFVVASLEQSFKFDKILVWCRINRIRVLKSQ